MNADPKFFTRDDGSLGLQDPPPGWTHDMMILYVWMSIMLAGGADENGLPDDDNPRFMVRGPGLTYEQCELVLRDLEARQDYEDQRLTILTDAEGGRVILEDGRIWEEAR